MLQLRCWHLLWCVGIHNLHVVPGWDIQHPRCICMQRFRLPRGLLRIIELQRVHELPFRVLLGCVRGNELLTLLSGDVLLRIGYGMLHLPIGLLPSILRVGHLLQLRCWHLRWCVGVVSLHAVPGWDIQWARSIRVQRFRLPGRILSNVWL